MNQELQLLYEADKQERVNQPHNTSPEYHAMRKRDYQRRVRAAEILDQGEMLTPQDYYYAALLFQHGDIPEDAWQAHTLALQALDGGIPPARWLAAAAYDRWCMYQAKPQKYGTNYVTDGLRHRLWDVDPSTTDSERAAWDVPPLAEQLRKAEEATRIDPPGPVDLENAPWWLKEGLKRWGLLT